MRLGPVPATRARWFAGVNAASMRLPVYVLTRTLIGIGVTLAVVAAVIFLVDFVELSRTLGGRGNITFMRLVELSVMKSPSVILLLLPFIFLFGVMGAFVSLNRRNELVAMRAAGVSAWRFTFPAAAAAIAVGLTNLAVLNPAAAALNASFEDLRAALTDSPSLGRSTETWLRQGVDGGQVVIHASGRGRSNGAVRLTGVSIFVQSLSETGGLQFDRRIDAREAVLLPGYWRLTGVSEVSPGSDSVKAESLLLPSPLDRLSAMEKFTPPGAVSSWDLPATIRSADQAGYASAIYRLRFQQLLAMPLMLAGMTLLAAAFSLRLQRLGDLPALAAAGVTLGFAVFFFNQFCGALGATETIPIVLAAWVTPVLALLSAVTILCYTEDG